MEIVLRGKGLCDFVAPEDERQGRTSDPTNVSKRDLALAYVIMSIHASCKATMLTLRDPREGWNKLKNTVRSACEALIEAKLSKLHQVRMNEKQSIIQYTNRTENQAK